MNVVFLGGGRITSAMLAGLRLANTKHALVVHDRNSHKLRDLKKQYAVEIETDLKSATARADLLVVAVRPGSVRELLRKITLVNRPMLAVSVAAGVPLRVLKKELGAPVRWARAMPSPLCRNGRGLTALSFPRTLTAADRKRVRDLFGSFGQVIELPEDKFDPFTVTYSCSHGYHALSTLANAAQKSGLDRKTALLASAHALADGILAWREGELSLDALLEEAVTPGGIAASAADAMDKSGYRRAVQNGVNAGLRTARGNARD
jgi:pyrroline-5-carboxylate reductase